MSLTKIVVFGVFAASITSLVVLWSIFFTMWLNGETKMIVYAGRFGEFTLELVGLTLSVVFLPVLLYEFDRLAFDSD